MSDIGMENATLYACKGPLEIFPNERQHVLSLDRC